MSKNRQTLINCDLNTIRSIVAANCRLKRSFLFAIIKSKCIQGIQKQKYDVYTPRYGGVYMINRESNRTKI